MSLGLPQLLVGVATALGTRVLPALDEQSYAAGDTRILAGLLILMAQDTDRAADRLARENRAMRALFVEAADRPIGHDLAARLIESGRGTDSSLVVSDLKTAHDRLSALLIELHAAAEASDGGWARELEKRIWEHLVRRAEDRAVMLPVLG